MLIGAPDVALPSRAAVDRAKAELERRLGPSKVLTGADACAAYASDDSDVAGRAPDAVVIAASTADVAATLAVAESCGVPVTPRAGGTGRTGGAVPVAGGIVLSTHALSRIKEIDRENLVAVVEPGVITGDLHAAVEREGLFYAPDPNSLESCMIGGNLAENAGGPRAFKYGVTRDWVLGLESCLMGGRTVRTGKRTVKGVTGYDVTALLVGSEGTLAVFTEATLRLVPKPPEVATALALFSDVQAAAVAVGDIVAAGIVPRCLEMLDAATLDAVRAAGRRRRRPRRRHAAHRGRRREHRERAACAWARWRRACPGEHRRARRAGRRAARPPVGGPAHAVEGHAQAGAPQAERGRRRAADADRRAARASRGDRPGDRRAEPLLRARGRRQPARELSLERGRRAARGRPRHRPAHARERSTWAAR